MGEREEGRKPNSTEENEPVARRKGKKADLPPDAHRSNAVTDDRTYGTLREKDRVVMRHNIALNLDSFNAATDEFTRRPQKEYPELRPVRAPFFSIVIPNHNGRVHLPNLFDALVAQSFKDFEVVFADDASTDDSVGFLESNYVDQLDLRLIVNRHNRGFVASVNAAADAAAGRVLVLLNNDTEPDPAWLEKLAWAVCENPQAAIVASKLLLFDERDRLHAAGDLMGADGIPRNRGAWQRDVGQFDGKGEIFGSCGGAMAIRKEVWEALGGFDEDFWMYVEDADFAFRAQLSGWRTVYAPDARVYHKVGASGGDELSSYYVGRNTLWLVIKNMPAGLFRRNFLRILAAQLNIALDALINIRGRAARNRLRGQIAAFSHLPTMLSKRALVQGRRRCPDSDLEKRLT